MEEALLLSSLNAWRNEFGSALKGLWFKASQSFRADLFHCFDFSHAHPVVEMGLNPIRRLSFKVEEVIKPNCEARFPGHA